MTIRKVGVRGCAAVRVSDCGDAFAAAERALSGEACGTVNPVGGDEVFLANDGCDAEDGGVDACDIGHTTVGDEAGVDDYGLAPSLADTAADAPCHGDAQAQAAAVCGDAGELDELGCDGDIAEGEVGDGDGLFGRPLDGAEAEKGAVAVVAHEDAAPGKAGVLSGKGAGTVAADVLGEEAPGTLLLVSELPVRAACVREHGADVLLCWGGYVALFGADGEDGSVLGVAGCHFLGGAGELVECDGWNSFHCLPYFASKNKLCLSA